MKYLNVLIAASLLFGFYSCTTPGCTDPEAYNYDLEALNDDGSCMYYVSTTIFWCSNDRFSELRDNNYSSPAKIYFDDELVGEFDFENNSLSSTASPSCSGTQSETITSRSFRYEHNLPTERGFVTIRIEDANGTSIQSIQSTERENNDCTVIMI